MIERGRNTATSAVGEPSNKVLSKSSVARITSDQFRFQVAVKGSGFGEPLVGMFRV